MGIGEADAAGRQTVEIRSAHAGGTIAGKIAVAHVVGVDEDDVGFDRGAGLGGCGTGESLKKSSAMHA